MRVGADTLPARLPSAFEKAFETLAHRGTGLLDRLCRGVQRPARGELCAAEVQGAPLYDPDGSRMRD